MRTRHRVSLGIGVGSFTAMAALWGCGEGTFGTCTDTSTCGDASTDGTSPLDSMSGGETGDGGTGDTGVKEGGEGSVGEAGCVAPTTQLCNGTCVDPTQPSHCGMSCMVCPGPDSGAGQATCTAGKCTLGCTSPTTNCGGSCVDEQTDPFHCGSCNACPGPDAGVGSATCMTGTCGYQCAADGGTPVSCGSLCVNTTNDPKNCGGCGTACGVPTNGMASCAAGADGGGACGVACVSGFHPSGVDCATTCTPNSDDPSTDPCVVATGLGTFVSPTGTDGTTCGTKASPCLTIAYAMSLAVATTKRVYACGTFTSEVVVPAGSDGVTVYGGLSCATWAYSASTPTTVAPTAQGYALEVTGTVTGVTFEDFVFTAQSAPSAQSATPLSSIAVFASGAKLTLTRVAVNAGSGQPGEGGGTGSNYSGATAQSGTAAGHDTGGVGGSAACTDGTTSTGGAGAPFQSATSATDGLQNGQDVSTNQGLTGGSTCQSGTIGIPGATGTTVGSGASISGTASAAGWTAGGLGGNGQNGGPAQGGGGGGSNNSNSAIGGPGGGGGAGGCGGGGGTGGQTGGSSIGVLSFQSALTMTAVTVTTASGGNGGSGGLGELGQLGGGGGAGGATPPCGGGPGNSGGAGAAGGGGAGGVSAGIVWTGTAAQEPSFNGTTYTTQAAPVAGITLGAQGPGGGNGSTPAADAVFKSN